jgi:hypothetical protein
MLRRAQRAPFTREPAITAILRGRAPRMPVANAARMRITPFALLLITSCTSPTPPQQQPAPPSLHSTTLQHASDGLAALPRRDLKAELTALAADLAGEPDVASASVEPEGDVVTVEFTDGRALAVLANDYPDTAPAAPTPVADAVPASSTVTLVRGLGDAFHDNEATLAYVLGGQYTADRVDGSVEAFRHLDATASAVLYIHSHGGYLTRHGARVYALWTSSCINGTDDALYEDDFTAGDVMYIAAVNSRWQHSPDGCIASQTDDGAYASEAHYGVTASFVAKHVTVAHDALAYLDVCESNQEVDLHQPLRDALFAAGANVYAGWTASVPDATTALVTSYVFDRLVGANRFDARDPYGMESPPQRAFGWQDLERDMDARGLATSADGKATIKFSATDRGPLVFDALAPSIAAISLSQSNGVTSAVVVGILDDTATASFAGTQLSSVSLPCAGCAELVLPDTPWSGPLQITWRGHTSNTVQITGWAGALHETWDETGSGTSWTEQFHRAMDMTIRVRAFVGSLRQAPHATPHSFLPGRDLQGAASITYTASGQSTSTDSSTTLAVNAAIPQPIVQSMTAILPDPAVAGIATVYVPVGVDQIEQWMTTSSYGTSTTINAGLWGILTSSLAMRADYTLDVAPYDASQTASNSTGTQTVTQSAHFDPLVATALPDARAAQ